MSWTAVMYQLSHANKTIPLVTQNVLYYNFLVSTTTFLKIFEKMSQCTMTRILNKQIYYSLHVSKLVTIRVCV